MRTIMSKIPADPMVGLRERTFAEKAYRAYVYQTYFDNEAEMYLALMGSKEFGETATRDFTISDIKTFAEDKIKQGDKATGGRYLGGME